MQLAQVTERARTRPAVIASGFALVLTVAYLLAPTMGVDLSAQLLRADFARHHPLTPVDLRWFGGAYQFGYSLWTPIVMAAVTAKIVGAVAAVASTYLVTRLLQSIDARRPLAGGVAAAICQTANLVEGRVAFGAGMAFGLAALLATLRGRRWPTALLAFVAGAANPVVALLLWLSAAVALARRRWTDGALLAVFSALPLIVISGIFGDGGHEPFGGSDALHALLASVLVALVIPLRYKAIRVGAGIGALMIIVAFYVHTPVGSNATRLSLLFAIPLIVALTEFHRLITAAFVVIALAVQTPVTFGTLGGAGAAATTASYYQPLISQLRQRGPLTGRVEIPEIVGHWDAYYVAKDVPLARGWLRQLDTALNGATLYDNRPTAAGYRNFLDENAVAYVAVPDARLSAFGRREASVIATLPYLTEAWRNPHWTLYAVSTPTPVVASPARLVDYRAAELTVQVPGADQVVINLRWSDWLRVSGSNACIGPSGDHVVLRTHAAGRFTISSTLGGDRRHC